MSRTMSRTMSRPMSRPSLFFVTPQYGRAGGVAVSAERICRSLRSDFEVTVIVPDRDQLPHTFSVEESPSLRIVRYSGGAEPAQSLQLLSDILLLLSEQQRPAAILSFYIGDLAYAAAVTAPRLGVPHCVFARGNDIDLDLFGERAFAIHFTLSRADMIFCVTEELAAKTASFVPGTRPVYIPNGVDLTFFPYQEQAAPSAPPVIGLFGEIKHKKGLDFLLAALPNECRLRIVGSLRPEAEKLLHAHFALDPAALERIEHVPFTKDREALVAAYHAVDLVCIPSAHDGMPNVLLEAMSCGKPVLASAVGGAKDVIRHGENGWLFKPRDPESFRRSLAEAVRGLERSDTLRQAARKTVEERYSWQHERRAYLEALHTLLARARAY